MELELHLGSLVEGRTLVRFRFADEYVDIWTAPRIALHGIISSFILSSLLNLVFLIMIDCCSGYSL